MQQLERIVEKNTFSGTIEEKLLLKLIYKTFYCVFMILKTNYLEMSAIISYNTLR